MIDFNSLQEWYGWLLGLLIGALAAVGHFIYQLAVGYPSWAQETYGVNPWVYLFVWFILAAPPWYIGLYWAIMGALRDDQKKFFIGVSLNRLGTALAPVYVLVWGEDMGVVKPLVFFFIPVIWSYWFYKSRLKNPRWVRVNRRRMEKAAEMCEAVMLFPFRPSTWIPTLKKTPPAIASFSKLVWFYIKAGPTFFRLLVWSRVKTRVVLPGTDEYEKVCAVERKVFEEEGYPYNYREYDGQSILIGSFIGKKAVGAVRLIRGTLNHMPPIVEKCKLSDSTDVSKRALMGEFEELGTVAVARGYRRKLITVDLYRAAYSCAKQRGVKSWGIIEEQERFDKMAERYFFVARRIGEIGFEGWPCYPFEMNLEECFDNIESESILMANVFKQGTLVDWLRRRGQVRIPPEAFVPVTA